MLQNQRKVFIGPFNLRTIQPRWLCLVTNRGAQSAALGRYAASTHETRGAARDRRPEPEAAAEAAPNHACAWRGAGRA